MAKLTTSARNHLSSSQFALPGKGEGSKGKGSGSYPIPDASHARNALARVAQHGSSSEQAAVRRKVHEKFPGVGKSDGGHGADPRLTGMAKSMHRTQEHNVSDRMHGREAKGDYGRDANSAPRETPNVDGHMKGNEPVRTPPKREGGNQAMGAAMGHGGVSHEAGHGGNGLIKAMHMSADKLHPC